MQWQKLRDSRWTWLLGGFLLLMILVLGFTGVALAGEQDKPGNLPQNITTGVKEIHIDDATKGLWDFIQKFMLMVTTFCGIAIVVIGGKIAAHATNPQKRSENIAGLLWAIGGAAVSSGAWILVGVATGVWGVAGA